MGNIRNMKLQKKEYRYFTLILFSLFLASCGEKKEVDIESLIENKDIEGLKKEKSELSKKQNKLEDKINSIETALEKIDPNESTLISLYTPQDSIFQSFIEIQGTVAAANDALIFPESSGTLKLFVKEGQNVSKGHLLGKVSDEGQVDQLRFAQAELKRAQINADLGKIVFEKQSRLWEQKIGSEIQYLQAKAEYEAATKVVTTAREKVNSAKKQLGNLEIRAPFDGVVETINIKSGQAVAPAATREAAILRLVGVNSVKIEAKLPEIYLSRVKLGTLVNVIIPALDKTIQGQVNLVSSAVDPTSRTFKIEIPLDNSERLIKPNLVAQLKINDYENQDAVVIPSNLIASNAEQKKYVFVIDQSKKNTKSDGVAEKKFVKLGKTYGGNTEILEGLKIGEVIINEGFDKVIEGDHILIVKN